MSARGAQSAVPRTGKGVCRAALPSRPAIALSPQAAASAKAPLDTCHSTGHCRGGTLGFASRRGAHCQQSFLASLRAVGHRSGATTQSRLDRQRDFPDKAGENQPAAQAVAGAFIRQKDATEADQRGERHSDLTSSVHVSIPAVPHE